MPPRRAGGWAEGVGDRRIFLREGRAIFLDGGVEIELAALEELQDGHGGDRFGNGPKAVQRGGSGGREIFEVGHAEAGGPDGLAMLHDRDGNAGDAAGGHEGGDSFFDFGALFYPKRLVLRKKNATGAERPNQGEQQRYDGSGPPERGSAICGHGIASCESLPQVADVVRT